MMWIRRLIFFRKIFPPLISRKIPPFFASEKSAKNGEIFGKKNFVFFSRETLVVSQVWTIAYMNETHESLLSNCKLNKQYKVINRVTRKGWDFRDDCTEFV